MSEDMRTFEVQPHPNTGLQASTVEAATADVEGPLLVFRDLRGELVHALQADDVYEISEVDGE